MVRTVVLVGVHCADYIFNPGQWIGSGYCSARVIIYTALLFHILQTQSRWLVFFLFQTQIYTLIRLYTQVKILKIQTEHTFLFRPFL